MRSNETLENDAPEAAQTDKPDAQVEAPTGEQPVSLAQALLGESEAKPEETPDKAKPQEGGKSKDALPKGLHDVAERLGVEPGDLYAIEVPLADGATAKLGELKDLHANREDVTRRELEIEERRTKAEADLTRAKHEIETLMEGLPQDAIKPEVLERVRRDALAAREVERKATLEAIPEWSDETKRTEELQGIVELMTDYGFPQNYLERNLDSRLVRLVRDSYLRKVRIERALAGVKKVEPTDTGKGRRAPPQEKKPPSESGSRKGRLRTLLNED